jgi:quinol monooxygenase YgiN
MIIRLVKLSFREEKIPEFIALFREAEENIRSFPGCEGLFFYRDINNSHVFFTYSIWKTESDLAFYRTSPLFLTIWQLIKPYFSAPAEAWSVEKC